LEKKFDEEWIKSVVALAEEKKQEEKANWTAAAVFERLDALIIGNKRYKQALALCLADFLGENAIRNHLLVVGPSGTGKTYLLEQCMPIFSLPSLVIDGSGLVPSGYKGNTLQEALGEFFKMNASAARRCVIVVDEFDKVSEKSNGGDVFKSHSVQSELLTAIQGKQEGSVDTRNALWILAGAFAYADEMRASPPKMKKTDLQKYGFKNELLGRITTLTMTDIPTADEVVRRVARDRVVLAFLTDLGAQGFDVTFSREAFLDIAMAAQNPSFGMRAVPSLIAQLKQHIVFNSSKGAIEISREMVAAVLEAS
jgi:ATP-dependent Clp protease ATP-binding subunit ClpX